MTHNHTLIIGSGIVGATLALKLAQNKMPVTLIDAHPARDESDWKETLSKRDARVYALSLASINLLEDSWRVAKDCYIANVRRTTHRCRCGN